MSYNPEQAVSYAHKWAFGRNPRYYDFDSLGGDCTNFISQCLYAGCHVMNYTPVTGWYYNSLNSRSAAWSGVEYLFRFLTKNRGPGPFGREAELQTAKLSDIIQLSFDGITYAHSLLVVENGRNHGILIAAHTYDSDYRPLSSYDYRKLRLISIDGANQ